MGPDLGMVELIRWISMMFPSMSEYTTIFTPIFIVGVTIMNMFSNILPEPGTTYPVPSVRDIDAELKDKGRIVYRLIRLSRWLTINVNRLVSTRFYRWFYKSTKACAKILLRIKGGNSGKIRAITKPKPFKVKPFHRKDNDD